MIEDPNSAVQELFERMDRDISAVYPLHFTLQFNKAEADVQLPGTPALFDRQYDEHGLIARVSFRETPYHALSGDLEFTPQNHRIEELFDALEENANDEISRIGIMMMMNSLEDTLLTTMPDDVKDTVLNKGPVIYRDIDRLGIPTGYALNAEMSNHIEFQGMYVRILRKLH